MNQFHSIACASLLAVLAAAASGAVAGEIYKWTDDGGTVHYGDRPTGSNSEQLDIESRATDPERVQQILQARSEARSAREEAEAAQAATEPTAEELQATAKERAEKCTMYKDRLQKFVTSRRLYRQDDNGERVYLDEEETLAARARVQSQVEEYCSS